MYNNIDFNKLFDNESDYGKKFNNGVLDATRVKEVEDKIGYKIPNSYYEFLKIQNGGCINFDNYDDCWLEIIYGIGKNNEGNNIDKEFDNWMNEWEYPNIGIPFGQTQSGGHDIYFMDYSVTDNDGEPRIVRIDNEDENELFFVANNFKEFIDMVYKNKDISGKRLEKDDVLKNNLMETTTADYYNGNIKFVPDESSLKFAIIVLRVIYVVLTFFVICFIIVKDFSPAFIALLIFDIIIISFVIWVKNYLKK